MKLNHINLTIQSSNNETLLIDQRLQVLNSSYSSPVIKIDKEYSFLQFEDFEFTFHAFSRDDDSLLVFLSIPEWLTWESIGSGLYQIKGRAKSEQMGEFPLSVKAITSSGLSTEAESVVIIKPNFGAPTTNDIDLPPGWDFSWVGTYAMSESGWCYHIVWGWVWFQSDDQKDQLWFLHENGNWYWTSSSIWNAESSEGYIYSAKNQSWFFLRKERDSRIIAYDYSLKEWIPYEQLGN